MKKQALFLTLFILTLPALAAAGQAPKSLAGFTLGDHLSRYRDKVVPGSRMCVRYQNYLHEVEAAPIPGFRSGLICVGNCAEPGRIVRVKLKYADSSKKFYEELLRRFTARFGKPDEWKGDAFGVMLAWKWSFTDEKGNKISLTLQHNSEDRELKMGNAVKLTMTSAIEREKACYQAKEREKDERDKTPAVGRPSWDMMVPR